MVPLAADAWFVVPELFSGSALSSAESSLLDVEFGELVSTPSTSSFLAAVVGYE